MLPHPVSYHVYRQPPLPALPPHAAYQYILAGNGLFIHTQTPFFTAHISVSRCTVRGLPSLPPTFRLNIPRLPARLLTAMLTDARQQRDSARQQRNNAGRLTEALYLLTQQAGRVQLIKPAQQRTPTSVITQTSLDGNALLCELHSHGEMPAFFSPTDNADEQGCRLYAVLGRVASQPEIRLRLGVYGHWHPLPITALFDGNAGIDLHA